MIDDRTAHWDTVYASKCDDEVSWFEKAPSTSLELIEEFHAGCGAVIDIGGGASRLVDVLIGSGYREVAVLDMSAKALEVAKARLGEASGRVNWLTADVTRWQPRWRYDVWHDRAAFHFLNDGAEQLAYAGALRGALKPGGIAIIATFAPDGPKRCSGLPVTRHDSASIAAIIGSDFEFIVERHADHLTPGGSIQRFQFSVFRRLVR
ncbi:MAG: class SAM-dependent methyltransferase [Bradyrhizobium sp.]|nr:class SAM-dependent methyltransferase [Bradyrhizobium sp.]